MWRGWTLLVLGQKVKDQLNKHWGPGQKMVSDLLHTGKYSPPFHYAPFHLCCQWANLRLGETVFFVISLLTQLCLGEFKQGKNVCKCRNANIIQGENNSVYSNSFHFETQKLHAQNSIRMKISIDWWVGVGIG